MLKACPTLPESCFERDCFALKWLKPGLRAIIFPFLVIFNRFVYDLFVFMLVMSDKRTGNSDNNLNSLDLCFDFLFA